MEQILELPNVKMFSKNRESTTKQLLPLFTALKFLGLSPLTVQHLRTPVINKKNCFERYTLISVHYGFHLKSTSLIISAFCGTYMVGISLIAILQSTYLGTAFLPSSLWPFEKIYNITKWAKRNTVLYWIMSTYELGFLFSFIILYILMWIRIPRLVDWLNRWNHIDMLITALLQFSNSAIHLEYENNGIYKRFKYYAIFYVGLLSLTFGTGLIIVSADWNYPIFMITVMTTSFLPNLAILSDDTAIILSYSTLELAFKSMVRIIKIRCEELHLNLKPSTANPELTLKEVQSWNQVVAEIRKQAKLAGQCFAPNELLGIALAVYLVSSGLYSLTILLGQNKRPEINWIICLCVMSIFASLRILIKIYHAVLINSEESKLSDLCKELEFSVGDHSKECFKELRNIHKMISRQPTEICLGGFVTLNNSLILSMFGQVLTQFIVLMQFQSSQ